MAHTNRFSGWASVFVAACLVAACGGTPEVTTPHEVTDQPSLPGDNGGGGGTGGGTGFNFGEGGDPQTPGAAGDGSQPIDSGPTCGDGKLVAPETCDDGNTKPGDGCDGNCKLEKNWVCPTPGKACINQLEPAVCGNGEVEGSEGCDLGKNAAGTSLNDGTAGCTNACQVVTGWTCPGSGSPCTKDGVCGDGQVQSTLGEQCDDGSNDGAHGCSADCTTMKGYTCPRSGGACTVDVYCGNGKLDPGEECDDHNLRSYDGCSFTCFIEPGWSCPATSGTCSRICGNGKLDSGETCDDSNFYAGDGCSDLCQAEPNYNCAVVGQNCIYTPPPDPPQCGNGLLETGEGCDDGNTSGGDGCSSSCQLESGWICNAPNTACVAKRCGDGILAGNEQCDDAKVDGLHGCTSTCTIVPNAVCPANGGDCIPMVCGDGKVTGTEQCDSGLALNDGKHGCLASCQLVPGWICPLAGAPCTEVCGDGIVVGDEQCDERADVACCSASCKLKAGFVCDPSKTPHSQPAAPYCGNGVVNGPSNTASAVLGSEQCDDGNTRPFDGCSPTCGNEPLCGTLNTYLANPVATSYQCFAHCGDGLVLPPEQCDDGNTLNNDGCDSNCKVELVPGAPTPTPAWTCSQPPPGALLTLPVVWRDFSPRSHPQFSIEPLDNRRLPGIAQPTLQAINVGGTRPFRYVPAYNTAFASPNFGGPNFRNLPDWTMNGPGWMAGSEGFLPPPWYVNPPAFDKVWFANQTPAFLVTSSVNPLLTPAGRFAQWYIDTAAVNLSFASTITLKGVGGAFQYSCDNTACDSNFGASPGFFPLDGRGWVPASETARDNNHNYSFTSEIRSWFSFKGGEQLAFFGDDDVWVFVNGQLTLDIGGIHQKIAGNFTLNDNGSATSCVQDLPGNNPSNCTTVALGLVKSSVYEIAIFHAEREIIDSNFQLTLTGFNSSPSVCTPICGDGFAVGTEQCDRDGMNVPPNGSTYGQCTTECKLGPYCGDKIKNASELCDNGLNIDSYVNHSPGALTCAPGCFLPVYCGDGTVQRNYGEECDDSTALNQNSYGHCQTNCKLGPRCGDKSLQAGNGETCDDGANNDGAASACDADCHLKCGNGKADAGEVCDGSVPGTPPNSCDRFCKRTCGNGRLDPGEQCDDGKNDGSYGTCKSDCTFAPSCGDMTLQDPPEVCDEGAQNSSGAYGPNSCTDRCLPGGYCGDGVVSGPEKCDDGRNTGLPGSCKADCTMYVPSTLCGDGQIQAPEKCDDGAGPNGNGSSTSTCDAACRFKCGNALVDGGEECDNGVNDGSYGTCTANCKLAGYCGDHLRNGNEQCDNGDQNVALANAYGPGVCTQSCKAAPFCGDGRIQGPYEECEGSRFCMNCLSTVIH